MFLLSFTFTIRDIDIKSHFDDQEILRFSQIFMSRDDVRGRFKNGGRCTRCSVESKEILVVRVLQHKIDVEGDSASATERKRSDCD